MTVDVNLLKIAQNPATPSKLLANLFNVLITENALGETTYSNSFNANKKHDRESRILSVLIRNPNFPKATAIQYVDMAIGTYHVNSAVVDYDFLQEITSAQVLQDKQLEELLNFENEDYYKRERLSISIASSPNVKTQVKYEAALKGNQIVRSYLLSDGFEELSTYLQEENILEEADSAIIPKEWIQKILGWEYVALATY